MVSLSDPGTGRARAVLAGHLIFLCLPFPFVALRFWSRYKLRTRLSLNDYLILIALFVTTGFNIVFVLVTILGGYGQHIENVTPTELVYYEKLSIVGAVVWPTAVLFVKLSVLHFYSTIFSVNKRTRQASYLLAGLSICFWLATTITEFTICTPFSYNWDKTQKGSCGNEVEFFLSTAIVNLLIDVMIVVLPLPSVWALQMPTSRKVSLSFIFGLGAIICAITTVRTVAISLLNTTDITYSQVLNGLTICAEPSLGIVNACLPIMQPVANKISNSRVVLSLRSLTSRTSFERQDSEATDADSGYYRGVRVMEQKTPRYHGAHDLSSSLRRNDNYDGHEGSVSQFSTDGTNKTSNAPSEV